jgi:gluconolactonase
MQHRDGFSRRRILETAAAASGLALLPYGFAARAQVVKRIDKYAPELDVIIDTNEPVVELGTGFGGGGNAEGPVWWHEGGYLLFSSIGDNKLIKYEPGKGTSVFKTPTNGANGHTRDTAGRMIACEGFERRVTREEKDGSITVVANNYQGKRINKPNDVIAKSDGSIYFTDPWNIADLQMPWDLDFNGVYRVSPDLGTINLLTRDLFLPNGLAFSPDEKILYIGDSRRTSIFAFDVAANGLTQNQTQRLFANLKGEEPGGPDGFKVDLAGNVFTGGAGGIHILDKAGKKLGRIVHGQPQTTNIAFGGDDWKTLYYTTHSTFGMVKLKTPGVSVPVSPRKG